MVLTIKSLNAQGMSEFELYQYDLKIINPAFAGLEKETNINAFLKQGNEYGRATSKMFSYDGNISKLNSGIGLIYQQNKFGFYNDWNIKGLYNYQYDLGKDKSIVFGTAIIYQSLSAPNNTGPLTTAQAFSSADYITWDLGMVYDSKTIFGGINIENLSRQRISAGFEVSPRFVHSVNATLGYKIHNLGNFNLRPVLFFRKIHQQDYLDINISSEFKNLIIGGMRYSTQVKTLSFNGGINWKNRIRLIGLIYSNLRSVYGNGYEILLSARV